MIDVRLIRHSAYNMLGLGLPLVVAFFAFPLLIHKLGEARFGLLTLIWAVVSYFGLFDMGLGRALTQSLAAAIADGRRADLDALVGTGLRLMLALGLAIGILMSVSATWLAATISPAADVEDVTVALYWMALCVPSIVLTSGYRGMLEARGEFAIINVLRVPMGVFTFAGPLFAVWAGRTSLADIAAILSLGRIVGMVAQAYYAMRAFPEVCGQGSFDADRVRPMIYFGGWMSLSNVVGPLMGYLDRFAIGFSISPSATAYYATPHEMIIRLNLIPNSIAAVLFPRFASMPRATSTGGQNGAMLVSHSAAMGAALLPIGLLICFFAPDILRLWISEEFASASATVLQIMSIGFVLNGIAQVPFAFLQGRGYARSVAILHCCELLFYVCALTVGLRYGGIEGAAWAWAARICLDGAVLFYWAFKWD